jgi:hypothetical protein
MLTVQIPRATAVTVDFLFVFRDFKVQPTEFQMSLPQTTRLGEVKAMVYARLGLEVSSSAIVFV